MKKYFVAILSSIAGVILCSEKDAKPKEAAVKTFKSVSMEEVLKLMAGDKDFVLLDVTWNEDCCFHLNYQLTDKLKFPLYNLINKQL